MDAGSDFKTPGQLIESLLTERGWSQRVLATVLEMSESTLNKLVLGKQVVSAEIALMLEEVFGVPADRFLALQKDYDLARARLTARPDPARATRARLYAGLPVADMIKRGWLSVDDIRDAATVEREVSRFFGVASPDAIADLPHAARKSDAGSATTNVQLAWLHRARQVAQEVITNQYSPFSGRRAVEQLKLLLLSAEEIRKVPRIMAEAGIRFVIIESLPSAKIDGACFWLSDSSPVIAMSLRYDRIDNFWFVLRHELEHVLRGHGKEQVILDAELEGEKAGSGNHLPEEERVANAAAAEFCVPQKTLDAFVARKAPMFAERDIRSLASMLKIHPGLVAGQLQHRTGRYDRFRDHLVKVRSVVTPGAAVDGWGDVAPVGL